MFLFDIFRPIYDATCCVMEHKVLWVMGIYRKRDAPRCIPLYYGLVGCYSLMVYIIRLWAGTSTFIFLLTFTFSFTGLTGCLS